MNIVDKPVVAYTEQTDNESNQSYVAAFAYQIGAKMPHFPYDEDMTPTLTAHQKMAVLIDNHGHNCTPPEDSVTVFGESSFADYTENKVSTLKASGGHNGDGSETIIVDNPKSIVRRLTPLECERLQGFPDNWTEGESDSARYKALGNSVALPCVDYIMSGIADVLEPICDS